MIFKDVRPILLLNALVAHAGADDLAQTVDVHRGDAQSALDLIPHRLRPRLRSQHPVPQRQGSGMDVPRLQGFGQRQRVGRCAGDDLRPEILQEQNLPFGIAAGHRDDHQSHQLGAVVHPQPAGKQPVPVRVLEDIPRLRPAAGQAAGAHLRPHAEVA